MAATPDQLEASAKSLEAYFAPRPHPNNGYTCDKQKLLDLARDADVKAARSNYEPMALDLARRAYKRLAGECSICKRESSDALERLADAKPR